jgi:hypothetical protein
VLHEVGGITYFEEGFPAGNRPLVVQESAKRLNCTQADADQRITAKEALLQPHLTSLAAAHTRIKGKFLLHQAYIHYISRKKGLPKDSFHNSLVRAASRLALHPDIRTIVEQRILAAP